MIELHQLSLDISQTVAQVTCDTGFATTVCAFATWQGSVIINRPLDWNRLLVEAIRPRLPWRSDHNDHETGTKPAIAFRQIYRSSGLSLNHVDNHMRCFQSSREPFSSDQSSAGHLSATCKGCVVLLVQQK